MDCIRVIILLTTVLKRVYSDRARLLTNVDTYGDSGCFTVSPGVIIPNFSPGPLGHISCKYVVINKTPQVGSHHTIVALMGNFCGGFTEHIQMLIIGMVMLQARIHIKILKMQFMLWYCESTGRTLVVTRA